MQRLLLSRPREVEWGMDLPSEMERFLTEKVYQKPVIVRPRGAVSRISRSEATSPRVSYATYVRVVSPSATRAIVRLRGSKIPFGSLPPRCGAGRGGRLQRKGLAALARVPQHVAFAAARWVRCAARHALRRVDAAVLDGLVAVVVAGVAADATTRDRTTHSCGRRHQLCETPPVETEGELSTTAACHRRC